MRLLSLLLLTLMLSACTATKAVVAMYQDTDDFKAWATDPRVQYQPGAEANARIVANHLDQAIASIEQQQFKAFAKPVEVYVTNSEESFAEYCVVRAAGCVLNERLFLSAKAEITPDVLPRILTHELSHLQMEQILGMWRWNAKTPAWFREGLAVYVSDSGGAQSVSVAEARQAILEGHTFKPNPRGSLLSPKTAWRFGLKTHMFYRQAGMFVGWLQAQGAGKFQQLLEAIQAGGEFEESLIAAYGMNLDQSWQGFVDSLGNPV